MSRAYDGSVPQYDEAAAGIDLTGIPGWTIGQWLKVPAAAIGSDMLPFGRADFNGGDGYQWYTQITSTGGLRMVFVDQFFQVLDSPLPCPLDTWVLSIMRYGPHDAVGSSNLDLYVGTAGVGAVVATGLSSTPANVVSAPMRIGAVGSGTVDFVYTGLVSRPFVFLSTLSDADCDALLMADPAGADFWTIGAINELVDYGGFTTLTNNGSTYSSDEPFSSGGGTTYMQSCGGSITPAGALLKQTQRQLTGGITPAGTLLRKLARSVAGTIGPSGNLTKRLGRTVSGTVTPAGILVRSTHKAVAGTAPSSGALTKQTQRKVTGGITPSGILVASHVVLKSVAGSITPAGAVIRQTQKRVAGAVAPAGQVIKQTARKVAGSITPAGAVVRQVARTLAGAISPSGTLAALKIAIRVVAGAITPAGTLTKRTNKTPSGTVPSSGTITKQAARQLAGSITPTGTLATLKATLRTVTGSIAPAGALRRALSRTVTGAVAPSGSLTRQMARTVAGSVAPAGTLQRMLQRTVGGIVGLAGALRRQAQKMIGGLLAPSGIMTYTGDASGTPPVLPPERRGSDPDGGITRFAADDESYTRFSRDD